MPTIKPDSQEQKQFRSAVALLVAAVIGLAIAVVSGLALVPRVRLVEVVGVVAGGMGASQAREIGIHP